MAIVWDPKKLKINLQKHGTRFSDAVAVLEDPHAITITDFESDPAEERFLTLGADALGRVLVVVYTWRGDDLRMISARPAEPNEREEYQSQ